jgi:multiple sugar transport system ATP-binding protein
MPRFVFDQVRKSFAQTLVLHDFSVSVDDGEFLVLLGPSGCGKSTLLRMIAGLTDVTSGTISFDDDVVNDWDVRRRNVAFVFQSYALYPQQTVRQNIAFPILMDHLKSWHHLPIISSIMRYRLMRTPAISEKVTVIAAQLKLTELLDRRPSKLSGGQRQRVALARSLVREPSVYLLDEPLSNLDAKLRTQMRGDITTLHRSVNKTFVYVTHDQVEAMTMATKIIVINDGAIQQIGNPDDIYDRPRNTFVATFVGSPPMNLVDGAALRACQAVFLGGQAPTDEFLARSVAGFRPERVLLEPAGAGGLLAEVEIVERVGAETLIGLRPLVSEEGNTDVPLLFVSIQGAHGHQIGDRCSLRLDPSSLSWFDRATGERIEEGLLAGATLEGAGKPA